MPIAVITGANRGIGLELSRQLKAKGYDIIAVCRNSSAELDQLGARVESGIDITRSDDLRRLAESLGGTCVDLLINNAGVLRSTSLENIEDQLDDFRIQYEVNALAPLRVTRALSEHLADGSKVVIITSRMGSVADNTSGGAYGYRMSKAAVNTAGVSLAHELKDRGIAVGLLHPGYVRTGMTSHTGHVDPDESASNLIRRIEELSLETTGCFRHANGDNLPW